MPEPYIAQLGRISGKLLSDNLVRDGIDLSFRNNPVDPDLLYLQVTDKKIGIKTDTPIYTLDVNELIVSTNLIGDRVNIDNIVFENESRITTSVGDINIRTTGTDPTAIFDRLQAGNVVFNENFIENVSLDQDLILNPNGTGTIELLTNTNITGNLYSTGTITLDGNLNTIENLTIGDSETEDTLTVLSNFQSNLLPSDDIVYDVGSSDLQWNRLFLQSGKISNLLIIGNVSIADPSVISSVSGNLNFNLADPDPQMIFKNGLSTPDFLILGNKIESFIDKDFNLESNGTGKVLFNNDMLFSKNFNIEGNIEIDGDLTIEDNVILGRNLTDSVIFNFSLDQNILPKTTLEYDLGSITDRWNNAYIPDWTTITTIRPTTAFVGNNMQLGGTNNIRPVLDNNDFILISGSNIYEIERVRFEDDDITNLDNTPLTLTALGTGYYVIEGDNGMVIPAGTVAERPLSPEGGSTRWNTDLEYIECFDPLTQTWRRSIGSGDVNISEMEDYSFFYTIILG
jgi:hypothetical protein